MNHPIIITKPAGNPRRFPAGLITAAVCGGLSVWLLSPGNPPATSAVPQATVSNHKADSSPLPTSTTAVQPHATPPPPRTPSPVSEVTTIAEMNRLADSTASPEQKLASFTNAMRHPDPAVASEAARRAIFFIKSTDYPQIAAPLLLDLTLSPAAMQVLGLNVHDRDPEYTLPLLARISAMRGHPLQTEAADTLVFYLGENARTLNGASLDQAIKEWLAGRTIAGQP